MATAPKLQDRNIPITNRHGAPTTTIVLSHKQLASRSRQAPLPNRMARSIPSGASGRHLQWDRSSNQSRDAPRNAASRGINHCGANVGVHEIWSGRASRASGHHGDSLAHLTKARPSACAKLLPFTVSLSARPERSSKSHIQMGLQDPQLLANRGMGNTQRIARCHNIALSRQRPEMPARQTAEEGHASPYVTSAYIVTEYMTRICSLHRQDTGTHQERAMINIYAQTFMTATRTGKFA